jgi:TRAP-type C4-dicarboxylate transport system permease small subunit
MLDQFDRVLNLWSRALLALAIIAGFLMMVHVTVDIFFRTALNSPLPGTNQTVAAYYMIMATFLPLAILGRNDAHISAEIFTERLSRAARRRLDVATTALGLLYMAVFTWQSWVSAGRQTARQEVVEIPNGFLVTWPSRWLLPIAGASLFLCLLMRVIRDLRKA